MMTVLELHALCTLFPRLVGAEFESLKADIVANGQREAIIVHEGLVLDGGNRYRACIESGIEPYLKEFTGADPVAFVLSANLHRRHLTPGQQAAIVASAQDWTRAHGAGGDRKSDQAAMLPLDSVADRAAQSGASERTQRMADKVAKESPELAHKVAHGEISLPKALEQLAPRAPAPKPPSGNAASAPAPAPAARPSLVAQVEAQQADKHMPDAGGADADAAGVPDDDGHAELLDDYNSAARERDEMASKVAELEAHIALLTRADLNAEVADTLVKRAADAEFKFEQLSGRNRQLQQTARDAQLANQSLINQLAKIRLALGVESNRDILQAIASRRAA